MPAVAVVELSQAVADMNRIHTRTEHPVGTLVADYNSYHWCCRLGILLEVAEHMPRCSHIDRPC